MSSPTFFSEGSTPRVTDTRWRILQKILGATIDGGGGGGGASFLTGSGSPFGSVTGSKGQRYYDTTGFVFYTNTDGTVNGWVPG